MYAIYYPKRSSANFPADQRAAARRLASEPRSDANCMPSGRPLGPLSMGICKHGTCKRVQSRLNSALPVWLSPSGASPGAGSVMMISSGSMISCSRRRHASARAVASTYFCSPYPRPSSTSSLVGAGISSQWFSISHAIADKGSTAPMMYARRKGQGRGRVDRVLLFERRHCLIYQTLLRRDRVRAGRLSNSWCGSA